MPTNVVRALVYDQDTMDELVAIAKLITDLPSPDLGPIELELGEIATSTAATATSCASIATAWVLWDLAVTTIYSPAWIATAASAAAAAISAATTAGATTATAAVLNNGIHVDTQALVKTSATTATNTAVILTNQSSELIKLQSIQANTFNTTTAVIESNARLQTLVDQGVVANALFANINTTLIALKTAFDANAIVVSNIRNYQSEIYLAMGRVQGTQASIVTNTGSISTNTHSTDVILGGWERKTPIGGNHYCATGNA